MAAATDESTPPLIATKTLIDAFFSDLGITGIIPKFGKKST
jgi:hypothetical protein